MFFRIKHKLASYSTNYCSFKVNCSGKSNPKSSSDFTMRNELKYKWIATSRRTNYCNKTTKIKRKNKFTIDDNIKAGKHRNGKTHANPNIPTKVIF